MKALEFSSRVTKKGITIPEEIKNTLDSLEEKVIKVIFLYEEENMEEKGIKEYALNKFLEGYDDEDKVYDSLLIMVYNSVDIVFIKFPFSNSKGYKIRPELVLQRFEDGDLILCRITSKAYSTEFDLSVENWEEFGLLLPSTIRVHKLITVESTLIDQKLGALSSDFMSKVLFAFSKIVSQSLE